MEDKTLWQIIKGTLTGSDNEGSSKRAATFYFTGIIITMMMIVYLYCYQLAVHSLQPTSAQMVVVNSFTWIFGAVLVTVWVFFGFTSGDKIMDLIKFLRGGRSQEGKTE